MAVYRGHDCTTLEPLEVEVVDGIITDTRPCSEDDAGDLWIAPGFVDLQVNGYGGIDFNSDGCNSDDVLQLTRTLATMGTTSFLPTIITAEKGDMRSRLATVARARTLHEEVRHAVPAVHLEGPSLSPEDGYRGAHPSEAIRPPSLDEFDQFQQSAEGFIRLVTFSPHWPESVAFVRGLRERGVTVAIGHTHASPEQISQAVDAGAQLSTHLGNGIAPQLPRHPNPIWTQLADDRLMASFIADGFHLPSETLQVMLRAKSVARSVLVSDAVAMAGSPPGEYQQHIGGSVVVGEDGAIRMQNSGLLAGSNIALRQAIAYVIKNTDRSLSDAIRMATQNPANLLNLPCGQLQKGRPADLVLFRWNAGDTDLRIAEVVVRGRSIS